MEGQGRDVRAALAQRRQPDLDRVQAEEEVLAEPPGGDLRVEVGVRGREDPHVDFPRARGAEALELSRLEDSQELALLARGNVRDLVQEQRAAVGQLEPADAVRSRIGERALDVSEELALEDSLRDSAGVQRHERPRGAARRGVESARDHALPGPVLPDDQHVRVGGADPRRSSRGPGASPATRAIISGLAVLPQDPVLRLQALPAAQRPSERDLRAQRRQQPRVVPRLLDEVARAAPHRLDGEVDAFPTPS